MLKDVCAITVSVNYLEHNLYSLKHLAVGKRKDGQPFWYVMHTEGLLFNKQLLEDEAIKIAICNKIPFIPNIRHGEKVTEHDIARLKKYGVAV